MRGSSYWFFPSEILEHAVLRGNRFVVRPVREDLFASEGSPVPMMPIHTPKQYREVPARVRVGGGSSTFEEALAAAKVWNEQQGQRPHIYVEIRTDLTASWSEREFATLLLVFGD